MLWQPAAFVLLAIPAALVLFSSPAGASPCLSSASAVRQEHAGSWPSWTLRAQGHEGVKCWFPATSAPGRDRTTRQISPAETATALRASTPSTRNPDTSAAPVPSSRSPARSTPGPLLKPAPHPVGDPLQPGLDRGKVITHPYPPDRAAVRSGTGAARASRMTANAVRPARRPVATTEQRSA